MSISPRRLRRLRVLRAFNRIMALAVAASPQLAARDPHAWPSADLMVFQDALLRLLEQADDKRHSR